MAPVLSSTRIEAAPRRAAGHYREHGAGHAERSTNRSGIDPATAVLIGGGGAAGLNACIVGRRLGCDRVIIPQLGGVLSAVGMLLSDLTAEFAATFVTHQDEFDLAGVNVRPGRS